jgi:ribonuclease HI
MRLQRSKRGMVLADFIVENSIELNHDLCMAREDTWRLFFDGSVCSQGQGVGCFVISPYVVEHEVSIRLEFECTNNQAEYEALLNDLAILADMGAWSMEAYGDSKLVV